MKSYKYLMDKASEKMIGKEGWEDVVERTCDFLEEIKKSYPEKVALLLKDLEDMICYPPITEVEAKAYVAKMVNKDGTTGEHWSLETVRTLPAQNKDLMKFDFFEFYIALNMAWSDRYHPNKKTEDYIMDAVDFLDDKDAPKNKMRRYMEHIK